MPKSATELLILGLVVAGYLLFNYLAGQLGKRAGEEQEAATQGEPAEPAKDAPLEDIWRRTSAAALPVPEPEAAPVPLPRTEAPAIVPPQARHLAASRRLFRTKQDLRQAVIGMTVLGPCRALEPPGDNSGRPPI